ncbi:hypothetical protein [Parvicella tangerina]|nr:hypothetical protein [Parvicella tangerina]
MSKWLRHLFLQDIAEEKSKPVTKPHRKIGINKNYDPSVWKKNKFKQVKS